MRLALRARPSAAGGVLGRVLICALALLFLRLAPMRVQPESGSQAGYDPASLSPPPAAQPDQAGTTERAALRQRIEAGEWDWVAQALAADPSSDPELSYWRGLLLGAGDPMAPGHLRGALDSEALRPKAQAALDALEAAPSGDLAARWAALGVALVGVGELAWAQYAFDAALSADPFSVAALAYRGYVKDQRGEDGLGDIQAAQALGPHDPAGYYFAGLHWRAAGAWVAARQAFLEAHFLAPENPAFAAEVGSAWELTGAYSDAAIWYRMAVELAPDDAAWYALLARFYVDSGYRFDDPAFAFVEAAAGRFRDHADLAASLGWALFQRSEYDRAYAELSRALGIAPQSARTRYYFGMTLERLGDVDGAADSFWFVLDTAPPGDVLHLRATRALERLGYVPAAP